jgi:hypothetical protein
MKKNDIRATVLAFGLLLPLLVITGTAERAEAQAQPLTVLVLDGRVDSSGFAEAGALEALVEARRSSRRGAWLIASGLSLAVPASISLAIFGWGQALWGDHIAWFGGSVVSGGLGLVLVALGAWQRRRGNRMLREQLASLKLGVSESGATVGWSGSF